MKMILFTLDIILWNVGWVWLADTYDDCLPEWTHWGERGQHNWCCYVTSQCCHRNQSPINIDTRNASRMEKCLETEQFRCLPKKMAFFNNGHTLELQSEFSSESVTPKIGDYIFDRILFRFGRNSSYGSEHTLNHKRMPLEMQIILRDKKYDTVQEAKKHPYGVQIMSVFGVVGPKPSISRNRFDIVGVGNNTWKGNKICFEPFTLSQMLPYRMKYYYEYEGSLTEPPCTAPIQWKVFHNPIYVTEQQLQYLRSLQTETKENCPWANCSMYDNYRKLQCLHDRPVRWGKDCGVFPQNRF